MVMLTKKKKTLTFKMIRGSILPTFPWSTYYTKDGYIPPELSLIILRPFQREFEEEITLYEGDRVEYDDLLCRMTVAREDGSIEHYPYKFIYDDNDV